ncbi:MAG: SPOR domain-containing protein [Clostridiales bacterium]|nr:SPOR domain-containing protein [Clostridiales bacterium]
MAIRRSVLKLICLASIAALRVSPALAQSPESRVLVQQAAPGLIEVKPNSSFTIVFRVANLTSGEDEYKGNLELPEGWRIIIEDAPFKLEAGEETIRLVPVFVPVSAPAGYYRLSYGVSAASDPSFLSRTEVEVKVLLEAAIGVELVHSPELTVAGETYQSRFLVRNSSNAAVDVALSIKSEEGYPFVSDADKLRLDAGEARTVNISVQTDSRLRKSTDHILQFAAEAFLPEKGMLRAQAVATVEVIPRVYGKNDNFHKLPAEAGWLGITTSGGRSYAQFKLAGTGALDEKSRHRVDFLFRGPSGKNLYLFGLQHEEYWLSYDSPRLGVHVGDKVFSLTPLTEYGDFGRGVEVSFKSGVFSLRGYYERNLFYEEESQKAFQLSFGPGEKAKFDLSYMSQNEPGGAASQVFSLKSQFFLLRKVNLNLEYSWDWTNTRDIRRPNSALWLESAGRFDRVSYQVSAIRSGEDYRGYYRNLEYSWAQIAYSPWKKIQIHGLYIDQKRRTPIEPYYPAFYDQTILIGANYQVFPWLNLSLEERRHDREDLSLLSNFNYQDLTWRLGSFLNLRTLNLQSIIDFGQTHNRLTGEFRELREYMLSANYILHNKLSFGGNLHYRDQDEGFTGDKNRQLNLNFTVGLRLRQTNIAAYFRTSLHQDFYRSALSEESFRDPTYLLKIYDVFGMTVTHRFPNGHQLGFRFQKASNPFRGGVMSPSFIGLLEYSIPVGVPVSRKSTVGILRGKVYDAENGQKGIEGVVVRANGLGTVTNRNGEYVFHMLRPGQYYLTLPKHKVGQDKIALQKLPFEIMVEGGSKVDCPIGLTTGASLSGRIVVYKFERVESNEFVKSSAIKDSVSEMSSEKNAAEGAGQKLVAVGGLEGAVVELTSGDDTYHQMSDDEGRFLFEGLRPGKYTLKVYDNTLPEFHVFEQDMFEFEVQSGKNVEVEIRVVPVVRSIQIIDGGEVSVKMSEGVLEDVSPGRGGEKYAVQVGAFTLRENAKALKEELEKKFENVEISRLETPHQVYFLVRINARDRNSAQRIAQILAKTGHNPLILEEQCGVRVELRGYSRRPGHREDHEKYSADNSVAIKSS